MTDSVVLASPVTYYQRYRMELSLGGPRPGAPLPETFRWVAWDDRLVDLHAEVNYLCFRSELDADVFPSLGDREGCRRVLREIRARPGFSPSATWLVAAREGCVGTIQGIVDRSGWGSIQNVGVMPGYRGLGIGRALVEQALGEYWKAGVKQVWLEVTANNTSAIRLYESIGFRRTRTSYRAVSG